MPSYSQALDLLIAEPRTVGAGLEVSSIRTVDLPLDIDAVVGESRTAAVGLDATVGPALFLPADLAVAERITRGVTLDGLLGPARFATLDVRTAAVGLTRPLSLALGVADTHTLGAALDALSAVPRTFTACLSVPIVGLAERFACLSVNVDAATVTRILTPALSVAVAETRNACPTPLDILISPSRAVTAALDLAVLVLQRWFADLDVNVCSPDLRVGASATYNTDGDEVEALLYVQDGTALHPEWIERMTATLLYRGQHDLGEVAFDCTHATGDGDVQLLWVHPAHTDNLSVRFSGTVVNCGDVQFDVTVGAEGTGTTFTPQLLEGVDNQPPRQHYTAFDATTRQLDAAPAEVDVIDQSVVLTLLAVDLVSDADPVDPGTGPVGYSGGGNRLLPSLNDDGSFVFQPSGTLPHSIGGYTVVEGAGRNLLGNSDFGTPTSSTSAVPLGYQVTSSTSVTALPEAVATDGIVALKIRAFGSGAYVGPKTLTFSRIDTVALTPGAPVTWSVLARLDYPEQSAVDIPQSVVKIDTLRLVISFRDAGDLEISQQLATFSPVDITGRYLVLVQNAVTVPPVGTVGVRVWLDLESIEASDDVNLYLMAPQVEESPVATSRMVGATPVSRAADIVTLPQPGNLEGGQGAIQIDFAAGYPGTPPADSCLFDTRTAGLDGLALYHLANGKMRFIVADPTGSESLDTPAAVALSPGRPYSAVVSWSGSLRSVELDGTALVESTATIGVPVAAGQSIYLLAASDGSARFSGVVTGFEIQREPRG